MTAAAGIPAGSAFVLGMMLGAALTAAGFLVGRALQIRRDYRKLSAEAAEAIRTNLGRTITLPGDGPPDPPPPTPGLGRPETAGGRWEESE